MEASTTRSLRFNYRSSIMLSYSLKWKLLQLLILTFIINYGSCHTPSNGSFYNSLILNNYVRNLSCHTPSNGSFYNPSSSKVKKVSRSCHTPSNGSFYNTLYIRYLFFIIILLVKLYAYKCFFANIHDFSHQTFIFFRYFLCIYLIERPLSKIEYSQMF